MKGNLRSTEATIMDGCTCPTLPPFNIWVYPGHPNALDVNPSLVFRSSQRNERAPDYKHKTTGQGLWLTSRNAPQWAKELGA